MTNDPGSYWAGVGTEVAGAAWIGPVKVVTAAVPIASDICIGPDAAGRAWAYWRGTDNLAWGAYYNGSVWSGAVTIPQMGPFG